MEPRSAGLTNVPVLRIMQVRFKAHSSLVDPEGPSRLTPVYRYFVFIHPAAGPRAVPYDP
jgi:hypothetical protein